MVSFCGDQKNPFFGSLFFTDFQHITITQASSSNFQDSKVLTRHKQSILYRFIENLSYRQWTTKFTILSQIRQLTGPDFKASSTCISSALDIKPVTVWLDVGPHIMCRLFYRASEICCILQHTYDKNVSKTLYRSFVTPICDHTSILCIKSWLDP